jgi:hypothetical protein
MYCKKWYRNKFFTPNLYGKKGLYPTEINHSYYAYLSESFPIAGRKPFTGFHFFPAICSRVTQLKELSHEMDLAFNDMCG